MASEFTQHGLAQHSVLGSLCRDQGPAQRLGLSMWAKVRTVVTRNTSTCIILLRLIGKDLLGTSRVPRDLIGCVDVAKEMEFTVPVMISCRTYVNSCGLLKRYLKDGMHNITVLCVAVQNP